ncbi:MAG: hypothetical protein D8M52_08855 [Chlorobi bacterium]|nr:MAG: hypothetical protein F9K28_10110 [Bacteroidota bacterium]KXK33102.1 MAG: Lipoprotein SPR [Chlorobi bacterium OLB6]MBE2265628.1 C40 family peptidase [Flavobacteriales bacterium]MBL1161811.1 hypothetical protein [Chlorobiota bacterium]MBZ0194396.1 C40 family peptidase [Candidatus Kapabacteria bacterium]MCC6331600.1 C40 family peptidase [Ignavibacteria bacterium]
MLKNRIFTTLCTILLTVFTLTVLGPTDAVSAVRSKTASVKKNTSGRSHRVSSKSKRKRSKSKRRRASTSACNPVKGKSQAIDLLRTQSPQLCKMAGLKYVDSTTVIAGVHAAIQSDSEDTDGDADVEILSPEDEADHAQELLELEAEDDVTIELEQLKTLWLSYVDGDSHEMTDAGVEKQKIVNVIMDWLGTRYHFGGTNRQGIDCSAFVRLVYEKTAGIELPRTAASQSTVGMPIRDRSKMKFGDLVFFNTRRRVRVSHVGIYLGDNLFAHASSRYGVTISSLESTYYNKRFLNAVRIDHQSMAQLSTPDSM